MVRMKLLKRRMPYAKKMYVQGDVLEVNDKDVRVLELSGIAEREESGMRKTKPRGKAAGTIMKAGQKKTATTKKKSATKREYQRRDMRAEK